MGELLADESFLKKGTHGWRGPILWVLREIENGQVAVLGALGCGQDVTLVDYPCICPKAGLRMKSD